MSARHWRKSSMVESDSGWRMPGGVAVSLITAASVIFTARRMRSSVESGVSLISDVRPHADQVEVSGVHLRSLLRLGRSREQLLARQVQAIQQLAPRRIAHQALH